MLKYCTFCRKTLKYVTFCREKLDSTLWVKKWQICAASRLHILCSSAYQNSYLGVFGFLPNLTYISRNTTWKAGKSPSSYLPLLLSPPPLALLLFGEVILLQRQMDNKTFGIYIYCASGLCTLLNESTQFQHFFVIYEREGIANSFYSFISPVGHNTWWENSQNTYNPISTFCHFFLKMTFFCWGLGG